MASTSTSLPFIGGRGTLSTTSSIYPDFTTVNTFGPLYLPQIYGSNMTAFEIASSGTIALTTRDVYSLTLDRQMAESNVVLSTLCNDTFLINVHDSNMLLKFDGNNNDITMTGCNDIIFDAHRNINLKSGGTVVFNSPTLGLETQQSMSLISSTANITMMADKNVYVTAQSNSLNMSAGESNIVFFMDAATNSALLAATHDVTATASNDIYLTANSNVYVDATTKSFQLTASDNNMLFVLDSATNDANLYTTHDILSAASNDIYVSAVKNVFVDAADESFHLSSHGSNMSLLLDHVTDDVTLATTHDILSSAGNDMYTSAYNNMYMDTANASFQLTAHSSNMLFVLDSATDDAALYTTHDILSAASNDIYVSANSNVFVNAATKSLHLAAHGSNMTFILDDLTDDATLTVAHDIVSYADHDVFTTAKSNMYIDASTASYQLTAHSSNMLFVLDSATNDASLYTSHNILSAASNDIYVSANSNVFVNAATKSLHLAAHGSNMTFILDDLTDDATLTVTHDILSSAGNDMYTSANSNMYVDTAKASYQVTAKDSNMLFRLDSATKSALLTTTNNITTTASNNSYMIANSNVYINAVDTSVYMSAGACNMVFTLDQPTNSALLSTSHDVKVTASNEINLYSAATYVATTGTFISETAGTSISRTATTDYHVSTNGDTNKVEYTTAGIVTTTTHESSSTSTGNMSMTTTSGNLTATAELGTAHLTAKQTFTVSGMETNEMVMDDFGTRHVVADEDVHSFNVGTKNMVNIDKHKMQVMGNLEVFGVIDSINVTQANLLVEDKEIYLAYNSNVVPADSSTWITDGIANTKSGLVVQGLPAAVPQYASASNEKYYGKSLTWNNNGGMSYLGSNTTGSYDAVTNESFWELKGGSFRLSQPTHIVPDANGNVVSCSNITFVMRVNALNELEIVKGVSTNVEGTTGTMTYKTIARFGRTLF